MGALTIATTSVSQAQAAVLIGCLDNTGLRAGTATQFLLHILTVCTWAQNLLLLQARHLLMCLWEWALLQHP